MSEIQFPFLLSVVEWFVANKAPDFEDRLKSCLVVPPDSWGEKEVSLIAFVLFSYAMNLGPLTWQSVRKLAIDLNIVSEFEGWAEKWISHSKSKGG